MTTPKLASVYVLTDTGRVKVGRSHNPSIRARTLGLAAGAVYTLHHATAARDDAGTVERLAHQLLHSKRIAGEWFDVKPQVAVAAVETAIKMVDEGCVPDRANDVVNLRLPAEYLHWLDEMRRKEKDIPNRSEMARRCIERQAREAGVVEREKREGKRK
jgi:hypothetical protein